MKTVLIPGKARGILWIGLCGVSLFLSGCDPCTRDYVYDFGEGVCKYDSGARCRGMGGYYEEGICYRDDSDYSEGDSEGYSEVHYDTVYVESETHYEIIYVDQGYQPRPPRRPPPVRARPVQRDSAPSRPNHSRPDYSGERETESTRSETTRGEGSSRRNSAPARSEPRQERSSSAPSAVRRR